MKVGLWSVLLVIVFTQSVTCNYGELAGHQIWKLDGKESAVPVRLLNEGLLDVLDDSAQSPQVRVAPRDVKKVQGILQKEGLSYEVLVHDLAAHFKAVDENERRRRDVSEDSRTCNETYCPLPLTEDYMTLEQMEWYLQELNETYPELVSLSSIGKSHEDRDIWLVHIRSDNASAKSVWIEGGLHAREWISPAVSLGLIENLVNDENMMKNFDFFIAPMANPDGYEYTWTTNRMWRKNRRLNSNHNCDGVDLNRNWDYYYGTGASSNSCSEVYKGTSAFSEPETHALSQAMEKEKDNLILVLSLHSYGQDLLYPWGWSHTVDVPNKAELINAGKVFANGAKNRYGKTYSVINSAGGLYYASGATDDWAYGVLGTEYVYTLELRDDGMRGFKLASDDVKPSMEEVWDGFQKLLEHIA